MDAISNLVFNSLAKHEGVRFPNIGSLNVMYNPAAMSEDAKVIPPFNEVVFSKSEPDNLQSIIDLIEYSVGADKNGAENLYMNWVAKMRGEDAFVMEKVGEIKQDFFQIYPELDTVLNPSSSKYSPAQPQSKPQPAGKKRDGGTAKANRETVILWIIIAVSIGAGIALGIIYLLEKGESKKPFGARTEVAAPAGNMGTPSAEQPVDAVPETQPDLAASGTPAAGVAAGQQPSISQPQPKPATPASGQKVYYVVAGVFSIDANADKFIAEAKAKGSVAQFTKVPYYGKTLVSAYTSSDHAQADRMRRQLSTHLDELWLREQTIP